MRYGLYAQRFRYALTTHHANKGSDYHQQAIVFSIIYPNKTPVMLN